MADNMLKTPIYVRRAQARYAEKFATKSVKIPKEIFAKLEEIYGQGFSVNAYVNKLILDDINRSKSE